MLPKVRVSHTTKKDTQRRRMLRRACACYACAAHRAAPPADDAWVTLIREMVRDGRLAHVGVTEGGKNIYRAN